MLVNEDFFNGEWLKIREEYPDTKIVMISGGFDPLHIGHLQYIIDAYQLTLSDEHADGGVLVAVVNGDGFLERKKSYKFMCEYERAKIVNHIQGVDYTMVWDDGTQYVDGAIRLIKPHVFAKGGDRSNNKEMPQAEVLACEALNVELVYGVGGFNKLNSSSELVENFQKLQKQA